MATSEDQLLSQMVEKVAIPRERTLVCNVRGRGTFVFKIPGQVQQQMDEMVERYLEEEERKHRAAELGGSAVAG